jgi:hypothetical protein
MNSSSQPVSVGEQELIRAIEPMMKALQSLPGYYVFDVSDRAVLVWAARLSNRSGGLVRQEFPDARLAGHPFN